MIFNRSKKLTKRVSDHDHDDDENVNLEKQDSLTQLLIKDTKESRLIGLYGELEEIKASQIIGALLDMTDESVSDSATDNSDNSVSAIDDQASIESDDADSNITDPQKDLLVNNLKPIEFIISTPGGDADDMFALYDIMRVVRDKCDIVTYGIGKVMSAGVLILASGTKGKRKIGRNCRVMIHSVVAGSSGSFHNLQNEMSEIKHLQKSYIKTLSEETNMSIKDLNTMINKKVNVYLSAEEAVRLGIADIIV
jgi:ATP-dependent Clp endopeptidase proteolytic subunit ClpP